MPLYYSPNNQSIHSAKTDETKTHCGLDIDTMLSLVDQDELPTCSKCLRKSKSKSKGKKKKSAKSELEENLIATLSLMQIPPDKTGKGDSGYEYFFHPTRKWRSDLVYRRYGILIEVEGGMYGKLIVCENCGTSTGKWSAGGRHVRASGYAGDCEKYNAAETLGFMLIRVTGSQVSDGTALTMIEDAIKSRKTLLEQLPKETHHLIGVRPSD